MAVVAVTAAPFIIKKPKILVGDATTGVSIECAANNVEASPEVEDNTYETYCGTYTSFKPPVWTVTVTVLQSFGTGGLWTLLQPLAGTVSKFQLWADFTAPASVDNPVMSGNCVVKPFAFLNSPVGEPSEFEVVLAVQGAPVFGIVTPTGLEAREAPGPLLAGPESDEHAEAVA